MAEIGSLYLNLPSSSTSASETFITALGLTRRQDWCWEDKSLCFLYANKTFVFYHNPSIYSKWLPQEMSLADTQKFNACIVTLVVENKEKVNELIEKAIAAGGTRGPNMVEQMGSSEEECGMYSRSVLDPDGHVFELVAPAK